MYFDECKYQKRNYWSFKEVLYEGNPDESDFLVNGGKVLNILLAMVNDYDYISGLVNQDQDDWSNQHYERLADLIVKRFLNSYCYWTESETFDFEPAYNFMGRLFYLMEMTSPKYLTLLKAYEDSQDELLSPVETKTSGSNRFNDTPQDEGDFANDEHTTNISEMENTIQNDLDSKMGRIREIESNYSNLLLLWSNEFESLFTEEENI